MNVDAFSVWAIFIGLAAIFGYLNNRLLQFPVSSGIFALSLAFSALVLMVNALAPGLHIRRELSDFLGRFDFSTALLHGMLCFLLFAGAWEVDLKHLNTNRVIIGLLAVLGVLISTAVIGGLCYLLVALTHLGISFPTCLVFAALISPTDPIAVLALLKRIHAPKDLEAQIAGESLFNDGIGVVVFYAMASLAGLNADPEVDHVQLNVLSLGLFFLQQMAGGIVLGLGMGFLALGLIRKLKEPALELLLILASAMGMYALSFWLDVSGPIAVVVAGILVGNYGRARVFNTRSAEYTSAFWEMIDSILNSTLYLLLGLESLIIHPSWTTSIAALAAVPITLSGRLLSVAIPVYVLRCTQPLREGLVTILTWGGLRGGLSVAMVLSLPDCRAKDLLLACTFGAVTFSVLVQSLTMPRLLAHFGIQGPQPNHPS